MNKTLYQFAIAFLALSVAVSLVQNVLVLVVGGPLFSLDAFGNWFFTGSAIAFTTSLIFLRYCAYKKFSLLFWTGLLSLLANMVFQFFFWKVISGQPNLMTYYFAATIIVCTIGIVYGLSFIFSASSSRVWLRRAGLYSVVVTSLLLILVIISISSADPAVRVTSQTVIGWTSLVAGFFPLMLLFNFRQEIKDVDSAARVPDYLSILLSGVTLLAFSFALVFGVAIAGDSKTHLYWQTKNAEATAKFVAMGEERSFTNAKGETLRYLLIKPDGYKPEVKYPLVVSLPYGGYEAPSAQLLATGTNRYNYPAFHFVPFCPEGAGWGGIPNYPTIDTLVFDAIVELEKEMSIDVTKRYVTGVSRGGYGSWHFITTRPDMFAAAIPVCGGGDPQLAPGIVNVSVWAFHGALDRNVPVSGSRDMIEAIKKAGGDPKYTEFEDKAHSIWYEVSQTPGVWEWLFKQQMVVTD